MGDGNPAPSRSNQDAFQGSCVVNSGLQQMPEAPDRELSRAVLYSHGSRKALVRDMDALKFLSVCHSLEDLLLLLERDAIDVLVFDEGLHDQECAYVTGWARIFKPGLVCEPSSTFLRRLSTAGNVA
jgi:hypothetical protein